MSGIPYETITPDPATPDPTVSPIGVSPGELGKAIEVEPKPKLYLGIIAGVLLAYLALTILGWLLLYNPVVIQGIPLNLGFLIYILIAFHVYKSVRNVPITHFGGIELYGLPLVEVSAGLQFVPWGILQLGTVSRQVTQTQFPGEPELVFKGDDKDPLGTVTINGEEFTQVRPIYGTTRPPTEDELRSYGIDKSDPLATQMTLRLSFFVRYRVKCYFPFVVRIGGLKEALRQLRDTGERVLVEQVSRMTTAGVVIRLKEINDVLRIAIEDMTRSWALEIEEVGLLSPDLSHDVSKALAAIPEKRAKAFAEADAVRTAAAATRDQKIMVGEGDRQRLIAEGEGNAAAAQALLEGEAAGRHTMMKKLKISGQDVIAAETAEHLGKAGTIIIGTQGFADALGMVAGIKSQLSKGKEKEPEPDDKK